MSVPPPCLGPLWDRDIPITIDVGWFPWLSLCVSLALWSQTETLATMVRETVATMARRQRHLPTPLWLCSQESRAGEGRLEGHRLGMGKLTGWKLAGIRIHRRDSGPSIWSPICMTELDGKRFGEARHNLTKLEQTTFPWRDQLEIVFKLYL